MSKEDLAPLAFYITELRESMDVYDTTKNNKTDIRAQFEVWKNEIAVADSLLTELLEK